MEQINYVDSIGHNAATLPVSKTIKVLQITAFVLFLLYYVYNYFIFGGLMSFFMNSLEMEYDSAYTIAARIGPILKVISIVILLCICSNKVSRVCCSVFLGVLLLEMALMNRSIEIVDGWSNFYLIYVISFLS